MKNKEETIIMRKTNMRIFPTYKKLAWDYLFFYTIDFLFLTQVKGISAADVVLKSTFSSLFKILLQIPASIIVEFLGRKNSIILGNVLNCLYITILMLSRNLFDILIAEFFASIAYLVKKVAEPSLLNESIPPSRYKSQIYSKINAKGATGYYILGAISKIIAGYLFTINGYLPFICSLSVLIIVTIMSTCFIEPIKNEKKNNSMLTVKTQISDIKNGFIYILKSERLKALIICSALVASMLTILLNYYVSLFEDLLLSSVVIGVISAIGSGVSAYAAKKQNDINKKLKNKTLFTNSILLSISTILAGMIALKTQKYNILIIIPVIAFMVKSFCNGLHFTIIERYLRNFANEKIDTKIFAVNNLTSNTIKVIVGLIASFLLDKMITAYCMIIIGILYTIIFILVEKYMKNRVGLQPEEYSTIERKYDEQKETI